MEENFITLLEKWKFVRKSILAVYRMGMSNEELLNCRGRNSPWKESFPDAEIRLTVQSVSYENRGTNMVHIPTKQG